MKHSTSSHILQLQRRFCVTGTAGVQPIGHRLSLRPQTLTQQKYTALLCRLMVSTCVI